MPALIDEDLTLFGGKADWETDPVLTPDPTGFDVVKATLCFRGNGMQLYNLLALGSRTCPDYAGRALYYTGPRVMEARFGYQIAELEWKGMVQDPWSTAPVPAWFLGANTFVRTVNIIMTTEESLWPRQDALGNQIYLKAPYAPGATVGGVDGLRTFTAISPAGATIVTGHLPWRVRLIGRAWAVKMTGITAGPRSVIVKPPKCNVADPSIMDPASGLTAINWLATGDPLVSYSEDALANSGWVCRNYDTSQEQPLGNITLARWTADYQWVERYGP